MVSKKWTLNEVEVNKVFKNAVIFLSPVALIYLGFVSVAIKDGFQWADFIPSLEASTAMMLWVVNTLIDIFRKFSEGK